MSTATPGDTARILARSGADREAALRAENAALRDRLAEAQETLRAIAAGEVDALVVDGRVYTLEGAETPYRVLVEAMSQGAATLAEDGTVLYCNRRFAAFLEKPLEDVIGNSLAAFLSPSDRAELERLIEASAAGPSQGELELIRGDGPALPVLLGLSRLAIASEVPVVSLVATDLTERQRAEQALQQARDTLEYRVIERTAELTAANASLELARAAAVALAREADTAREEAERANADLQASEARYRDLVNRANSAIIRWRSDGTVTFFNEYAQSFFGYSAAEILGKDVGVLLPERDSLGKDLRPLVQDIVAHPERYAAYVNENLCRDGRRVWMTWTNRPVLDAQGRVAEILAVGMDITERKRAEEALREADRRKDEFLATLAHELRNPLAPIANAVHILKLRGQGDPASVSARQTIERQLQHMVRLIDDLLDVSRITRGKLRLRSKPTLLSEVLDQAMESARPQLEAAGQELEIDLPPEPIGLSADAVRLVQVFLNLLDNACKYSAPGGRIRIRAEREGTDAVVTVSDTGVGIAPEHLGQVFEMFVQLGERLAHRSDPSRESHGGIVIPAGPTRSQSGLGIGLSLSRALVEMHGGSIRAHSDGEGQGSRFVVRLPCLPEPVSVGEPRPEPRETGAGLSATLRILVADDNPDVADSLGMLLTLSGYQVETARDGLEAVEAAERFRPDLVLLDIGMPGLDGYGACRRIRTLAWGRSPTIVALTGWGQEDDRRRSREAGFDNHLIKPVEPTTLLKLLADVSGSRAQ